MAEPGLVTVTPGRGEPTPLLVRTSIRPVVSCATADVAQKMTTQPTMRQQSFFISPPEPVESTATGFARFWSKSVCDIFDV